MWVLLIEDEERLASSLAEGLEEEGYTVDVASDGVEGETLAQSSAYDALIVDWRLPRRDGKTVVEHLRADNKTVPILMLTALSDPDHRIEGLDAGADDYLPKPFVFEELLARLRALLRRPPLSQQEEVLRRGPLSVDSTRREVHWEEELLNLRPKEFELIELLARRSDEVLSRTVIAERVWGDPFYVSDNAIDVTVSGLRQKLSDAAGTEEPASRPHIETVRGVGYQLVTGQ